MPIGKGVSSRRPSACWANKTRVFSINLSVQTKARWHNVYICVRFCSKATKREREEGERLPSCDRLAQQVVRTLPEQLCKKCAWIVNVVANRRFLACSRRQTARRSQRMGKSARAHSPTPRQCIFSMQIERDLCNWFWNLVIACSCWECGWSFATLTNQSPFSTLSSAVSVDDVSWSEIN